MVTHANGTPSDPLVERSETLYTNQLQAQLEARYQDHFVAIEPDSAQYFLGKTMREALAAASQALPDKMFYVKRIGHTAAIHIGVWRA
jgi:hypothetical protein